MTLQYTIEGLTRLRESPLVRKPSGLLPIEEWMGPVPDQSQRKPSNKGKVEEPHTLDGATNRRPLFESRMSRGLSSAPEDIVLGPPKTAFTSSARNTNKTNDPSDRAISGYHNDDRAKDSHHNHKERNDREEHNSERDGELSRVPRQGTTHNRRSLKDDNEPWVPGRLQKHTGGDNIERPFRRNGEREHDRDRDSGREPKVQRGFENHRRDAEREGGEDNHVRRNGAGRGRFDAPWSRDDGRHEGETLESAGGVGKSRDWRDKERSGMRGSDRDWSKAGKQEQDPEWMAEPEPEETKQSHTQEDFERWKERMKATNGPTQDSPAEPPTSAHERSTSTLSSNGVKGKVETPLVVDPSFDGFFGLWNEPKDKVVTNGVDTLLTKNTSKANTPKPSKFTGFFNPKPPTVQADPEPPVPPLPPVETAKDSSNEDREGFQRILQLLDRQQPSTTRNGSPPREQVPRNLPASPPAQSPQARDSASGLESLLASQANRDAPPPNRDSEFLLKLMQQTQQSRPSNGHASFGDQRQRGAAGPGTLNLANLLISPRDPARQTPNTTLPPGLYNEGPRDDLQRRDKLNPNSDRKGPPPGFYEVPNHGNTQRHPSVGANQQPNLPVGLQRPPGLEQLPSYSQFPIPRQNNIAPPPGFQQVPPRNPNPFPPGLMANPQYGMRPGVSGPIGIPAPGFMNMNAPPPPGFPPLPFNQEGRISPPRMFLGGSAQRPPMDASGDPAAFQIPPGAFRRQE